MAPTPEDRWISYTPEAAKSRPPEATEPAGSAISPQMQHAMRTLSLDRATAEVVFAWRQAGVRSVMLKGPAVSRWLYREDEVRGYSDIDLLVPDPEVGAAERS